MQKWKIFSGYGISAVILGAAVFCFTVLHVRAGETAGAEVFFTHTHTAGCYRTITGSCMGQHTRQPGSEYRAFHCTGCGSQTSHYVTADTCRCPAKNSTWQENGKAVCTVCGTVHSTWNTAQSPEQHSYTQQSLVCGMAEGENTLGIRITANDGWTNSGVSLSVGSNVIKQDAANGSVSYDWNGGSLYVTENGTYSVNATNGAGKTVTASIEIRCIDKTAPSIGAVSGDTEGMSKSRIAIQVQASDGESGLAENAFSFDGGASWSSSPAGSVEEGAPIQIVVRDKAGNTAARTVKRSDFPYPPEPAPSGTSTGGNAGGTTGNTAGGSMAGGKTDSQESNKESGRFAAADKTVKEETSGTDAEPSGTKTDKEKKAGTEKKTGSEKQAGAEAKSGEGKNPLTAKGTGTDTTDMQKASTGQQQDSKDAEGDAQGRKGRTEAPQITIKRQDKTLEEENAAKENAAPGQETGDAERDTGKAASERSSALAGFFVQNAGTLAAGALFLGGMALLSYLLWLHSAVLYCYNGGDAYQKLGLLHLKKEKDAFSLYLPDYLAEAAKSPRYRLLLKSKLVKRRGSRDLVVYSEDHKLRQPLEECVDFVL